MIVPIFPSLTRRRCSQQPTQTESVFCASLNVSRRRSPVSTVPAVRFARKFFFDIFFSNYIHTHIHAATAAGRSSAMSSFFITRARSARAFLAALFSPLLSFFPFPKTRSARPLASHQLTF